MRLRTLLPALIAGLVSGRLLSELAQFLLPGSWLQAGTITLLTCAAAWWFRRRLARVDGRLFLFPALYLFFPAPNLTTAGILLLLTLFIAAHRYQWRPPLSKAQQHHLGRLAAFLLPLTLYTITLSPGLLPADNGEFQLIGAQLGVAHPPGFPLYTLLAHAAARIGALVNATPAAAINLLSALIAAGTLALLFQIVLDLTGKLWTAAAAATALAGATTFWAQAVTANIRMLTAFFATLTLFALIRCWQSAGTPSDTVRRRDRYLTLTAFSLALGFTHHLSLAFMGLIFVGFALLVDPALRRSPRRWAAPFLAALLGVLPLLYLPLRANAGVRGAGSSLATWDGFLTHFLGLGFQGDFFYFITPGVLWERLQVMGNVLTFQFSPWLLAGMALGFLLLARRSWRLTLLIGASFALHSFITATYRAPQTVEYMLPAYIPTAITLGIAAGGLEKWPRDPDSRRMLQGLLAGSLLLAALVQIGAGYPGMRALHHSTDTRDYAQTVLEGAPADSVLLANWHWVTPLWYLQEVEAMRPDVIVRYVAPGEGAYAQTWAQEIGAALANGRAVVATWYDAAAYAALPPPEPLGEAFLFRQRPLTALPANLQPLTAGFNGVTLRGYAISSSMLALGDSLILTAAWEGEGDDPAALFAHLLGSDGRSAAQFDQPVTLQPDNLTITRFTLTPRPGTPPGVYTLVAGAGTDNVPLTDITLTAAAAPPVTTNPRQLRALGESEPRTLTGYDWDFTLPGRPRLYLHWRTAAGYQSELRDIAAGEIGPLPRFAGPWGIPRTFSPPFPRRIAHYVPLGDGIVWTGQGLAAVPLQPGMRLPLDQTFIAGKPVQRDYVVSVRLVGYEPDLFTWAWCDLLDGVPAMGGIPTLKWLPGSVVRTPYSVLYPPAGQPATFSSYCRSEKPAPGAPLLYVAPEAVPGQTAGAILRLYDAFTGRPLPILDDRIIADYSWIPLGETFISE